MTALLALTLVPGAPIGYAQDRPTTAAPRTRISGIQADSLDGQPNDPLNPAHPLFSTAAASSEPLNALSDAEATEPQLSDFSAPSASSAVQDADSENVEPVLADAQTSGGLLIAVPQERLDALLAVLAARGVVEAAHIGAFTTPGSGRITVRQGHPAFAVGL